MRAEGRLVEEQRRRSGVAGVGAGQNVGDDEAKLEEWADRGLCRGSKR